VCDVCEKKVCPHCLKKGKSVEESMKTYPSDTSNYWYCCGCGGSFEPDE